MPWQCALQLDSDRRVIAGDATELAGAIRRASDLRIYTEFRHNEHIDLTSDNPELVQEVAEFGVTYLIDDAWSAGIMSLRQPISLPGGFGQRPSMSFFLYNQNGQQAIARPYMDGAGPFGQPGPSAAEEPGGMRKLHAGDAWDGDTNAPSNNFIYDFETYRFSVSDTWREALSHDETGSVQSGSVTDLADAFAAGCAVKLAVAGLCDDLVGESDGALRHEVFVQAGSCYYYTEQQLFIAGSHPVIRVRPGKPMLYTSGGWDFGWLMVRTDGHTVYRRCDPYTLAFRDVESRHAVRWFVR